MKKNEVRNLPWALETEQSKPTNNKLLDLNE